MPKTQLKPRNTGELEFIMLQIRNMSQHEWTSTPININARCITPPEGRLGKVFFPQKLSAKRLRYVSIHQAMKNGKVALKTYNPNTPGGNCHNRELGKQVRLEATNSACSACIGRCIGKIDLSPQDWIAGRLGTWKPNMLQGIYLHSRLGMCVCTYVCKHVNE